MDPLSITTGILTLIEGASATVRGAEAFWQAPHELQELHDELAQIATLATFLKWATAQHDFSNANTDVTSSLARTQQSLDSARLLVDNKFKRKNNNNPIPVTGPKHFKRRAWLWHHGSVKRLKHDLVIVKRDLSAAADILSLTLLLKHQGQIQELLSAVQRSVEVNKCTSCGSAESLCSSCQPRIQPYLIQFESVVTNVHNMTRFKRPVGDKSKGDYITLTSSPSGKQLSLMAQELESLREQMIHNQRASMETVTEIAEEIRQQQSQCNSLLFQLKELHDSLRYDLTAGARPSSAATAPAAQLDGDSADLPIEATPIRAVEAVLESTLAYSEELSDILTEKFYTPCSSIADFRFEMSASYFPEQYVPEGPFDERIAVLSMMEQFRAVSVKVDKYFLLYAETPRRWRRITVLATTIINPALSSPFDVRAGSSLDHSCKTLPQSIHKPLETLLEASQLFDSVTNVAVQLEMSPLQGWSFDGSKCLVTEDRKEAEACETSLYLSDIEHVGCPQFLESEIVVHWRISSSSYLVLAESQACIERIVPFADDETEGTNQISEFMKDLWMLFELKECRSVAAFVGIVVDDSRRRIKSYLQKCPDLGSVQQILERATLSGDIIPWSRRAQWIRQIIAGVAEVHAKGKVVGCIEVGSIGVDADDRTVFTRIAGSGNHWPNRRGYLPPEMRRDTASGMLLRNKPLTFQSDIFQLGLAVWLIAKHSSTVCGIFCRESDCQTLPHYTCLAEHSNPVELPACCGAGVPAYVDDIVSACRSVDPARRPPASRLLKMLPKQNQTPGSERSSGGQAAGSLRDRYSFSVNCDECGMLCTHLHYHCAVCNLADFDICSSCFLQGIRCFDPRHSLIRRTSRNGRISHEDVLDGR